MHRDHARSADTGRLSGTGRTSNDLSTHGGELEMPNTVRLHRVLAAKPEKVYRAFNVSVGTELNIVQEGLPDMTPPEACYRVRWACYLKRGHRPDLQHDRRLNFLRQWFFR
jgi:hypothetical protein